jgi:hypothetical protein
MPIQYMRKMADFIMSSIPMRPVMGLGGIFPIIDCHYDR